MYNQGVEVAGQVARPKIRGFLSFLIYVFFFRGIGNLIYMIGYIGIMLMASSTQSVSLGKTMIGVLVYGTLIALNIATAVTIIMGKRLGKTMAIITMTVSIVAAIIDVFMSGSMQQAGIGSIGSSSIALAGPIGYVFVSIIEGILVILYFQTSKRVKATLVK